MQTTDDLFQLLVMVLRAIDFDVRYYGFYQRVRNHTTPSRLTKSDLERVLADTGLVFKYNSKERFFTTEKRLGNCALALKLAARHDDIELVLDLETQGALTGGPFSMLANAVGVAREPSFAPIPPYPRFPFSNVEQLREIVQFTMELFIDIERTLVNSGVCRREN